MFRCLFILSFFINVHLFSFSQIHSYQLTDKDHKENCVIGIFDNVQDFNELLLSWNALRPEKGSFMFFVSVKTSDYSPWIPYAEWSSNGQQTFSTQLPKHHLTAYQDTVNTTSGMFGKGFRVKVEAKDGADLKNFHSFHISTANLTDYSMNADVSELEKIIITPIKGRSQMILPHTRVRDLCSPTATSTVINFLKKENPVDPCLFADRIHDDGFDIYGNWALNVAEAYSSIGDEYSCSIERLSGLKELHSHLMNNMPVVVSVKGQIPGAPIAYPVGHLMVIIGLDPENQRVYCIDSAFDSDEQVYVDYDLQDFLKVWTVRKNLAYIFRKL